MTKIKLNHGRNNAAAPRPRAPEISIASASRSEAPAITPPTKSGFENLDRVTGPRQMISGWKSGRTGAEDENLFAAVT